MMMVKLLSNTMTTTAVTNQNVEMNKNRPVVLVQGLSYDWSDVSTQMTKYKQLTSGTRSRLPSQTQDVISNMLPHLKDGYKSLLFDFKVRELQEGDCGCALEDWHIDVVRNPKHNSKPDNHLIYSTVVGTEFMLDKLQQNVDDFAKLVLPKKPNVWQAPVDSIVQFDRFNLHRGPIVEYPCKRVLIRLTQTDVF